MTVPPIRMLLVAALAIRPACGLAAGFLINHRHVELFEQIPEDYVTAARNLGLLFSDRSVGQNIHEGLDCLAAASWSQAPSACRRDYYDSAWHWKTFTQADRDAGLVPARILYDADAARYSRANWTFVYRSGSWSELTQDFTQSLAPSYLDTKDVLSYQFSYLNVDTSDDIADPQQGFFADSASRYDAHDLEAFMAQNPDKVFVFWTTSLARGIGTAVSDAFNQQMREYCEQHGRILFDAADILATADTGVPCVDNRDGVPYVAQNGASENHPDDGHDYLAICQDYTTEVDGGHLGSVSAGKIRIAKAMWVLMARIAGWDPSASTPHPADLDTDGDVDADDVERFIACLTGPTLSYAGALPPVCSVTVGPEGIISADFDRDLDLDQSDFGRFQRCLSGPDIPAEPHCAD